MPYRRCPPKALNDLYYVLATLLTILVLLVVIYLEQKTMTETIRRSECAQHLYDRFLVHTVS